MDLKSILWYVVLTSITGAYFVALAGVRSAKVHDVSHHARRMSIACTVVGIWLIAYILKQLVFGGGAVRRNPSAVLDDVSPYICSTHVVRPDHDRSGRLQPLHGLASLALWQCRRHGCRYDHASKTRPSPHLDILRHNRDRLSGLYDAFRLAQGIIIWITRLPNRNAAGSAPSSMMKHTIAQDEASCVVF